jgi:hypothetical protein
MPLLIGQDREREVWNADLVLQRHGFLTGTSDGGS